MGTQKPENLHRTMFFRDPDGNVLEIYAEIQAIRIALSGRWPGFGHYVRPRRC